MSGGSLDYVYGRVDEAACRIRSWSDSPPLHLAFADHLDKVAVALKALEWVLSGDSGRGDEVNAIRAVLAAGAEIEAATKKATKVLHELQAVLDATDGGGSGA